MCCRYNAIDVPLVQGLLEILGTTYASNPDGSGYRPSPKCSTFNTRLGSLEPVHSGKGGFTHIGPSSRPAASMNRPERKKEEQREGRETMETGSTFGDTGVAQPREDVINEPASESVGAAASSSSDTQRAHTRPSVYPASGPARASVGAVGLGVCF